MLMPLDPREFQERERNWISLKLGEQSDAPLFGPLDNHQ